MNNQTLHKLMIVVGLVAVLAASFATLQIASAQRPVAVHNASASSSTKPGIAPREPLVTHLGSELDDSDGAKSDPLDLTSATASVPGARFVHVATAANTFGAEYTLIDHPLTNNNPNAIIFVTQNYNPGNVGGTYNDHPIGVQYSGGAQKWAVFNQDAAAMPIGAAFNVLIPAASAGAFVHTATVTNTAWNWTAIDHPLTNNNPNAVVLVTQNWNPGGVSGIHNPHSTGVFYSNSTHEWAIFNQNYTSTMPIGADFNVLIPPTDAAVFVHTATADNIFLRWTYIDHPLTNNNPNAIVLVTQNWNPGGGGSGTYNDNSIGVWYDNAENKWAIFNQDGAAIMPEGPAFNVLIPATDSDVFVHTATVTNTIGNYTYIDHPLTNSDPNAILLVTQNYNPGNVGGTYNNHPIGVRYSSAAQKWIIFNQDSASIPGGAAFNVLIPSVDTATFVHIARAASISSNYTYIDHPLTNNNPDAIVLVTQNWNPSGVGNTDNPHPIGVWYSGGANKWAIFNQDLAAMPVDAAFNVLVPAAGADAFVHTATAAKTVGHYTLINQALTNNNPNAIVLVTQNWNPSGTSGTYNEHFVGVWYNSGAQKWTVFNQDTAAMPEGADFNVLVIAGKVYLPLVIR